MSKDRGSRTDAGAALVFVVLLMLALVGLGHGMLVSALGELAASSAGARHLAARAAADAAVAQMLRTAGGSWMDSVLIGESRTEASLSLGRARGSATLIRLARESWLVQGRGTGAASGETRTAILAWALDPLERVSELTAAVSGREGALWRIEGQIEAGEPARVEPPMDAAACAPWQGELQARYATTPLGTVGVATDTAGGPALGLVDFASIMAAAEIGLAGSGAPAPVERLGVCAVDEPWGWGDPDDPTRPCGPHLPLRSADGDLTVEGGAGQGLLVVDGDLTLRSGARFYGLVVVRGMLRLEGAATLEGMAIAWEGAHVGVGSRVRASACWGIRALAAQRAALGGLRVVPGVGPIGPL